VVPVQTVTDRPSDPTPVMPVAMEPQQSTPPSLAKGLPPLPRLAVEKPLVAAPQLIEPQVVQPFPPVANLPSVVRENRIRDVKDLEDLLLPLDRPGDERFAGAGPRATDVVDDRPVEEQAAGEAAAVDETPPVPAIVSNGLWHDPAALLARLDDLAWDCETGPWARDVQRAIRQLGTRLDLGSGEAGAALADIQALRGQVDRLADSLSDETTSLKVRRAGFALDRRLLVWNQVVLFGGLTAKTGGAAPDPQKLALCVAELRTITGKDAEGAAWAKYLALDALRELADGRRSEESQRAQVAQVVLRRITSMPMGKTQREFIAAGPVAALKAELRRWAVEPVEFREILKHIEQYEESGSAHAGRLVAEDCQRLALSDDTAKQELARQLDGYYRNANVRIALSGEFLNKLIPERPPEHGCVRDVVLGNVVEGQSTTYTKLGVRLIPDNERLRMALEIEGLVASLTSCTSGPATFHNQSQSVYRAWKEVEIGREGMRLKPADVAVANDTQLRALSTDFDGIPIIGPLAKEVARSQHEQKREQMRAELEEKVYSRAKTQIDTEADARLKTMAERLRDRIAEPLADLALGPAVIDAQTTNERVVLRLRMASEDQAGGHTPRPRAPSDSLLSVQMHESAMNNLIQQLQLDGQTFTLVELRDRLASRLHRPEVRDSKTEYDDVRIAFAPVNAAQLRCQDGRLVVTLSIARLARGNQAFEDFQIQALYRPAVQGRTANLVRDDVIHLIGERIPMRAQLTLRGIFERVFAEDQPLKLIPDRLLADPRLAGLVVEQFALEDGWLGFALGYQRPVRAPSVARARE
jgi:hypothetical protein